MADLPFPRVFRMIGKVLEGYSLRIFNGRHIGLFFWATFRTTKVMTLTDGSESGNVHSDSDTRAVCVEFFKQIVLCQPGQRSPCPQTHLTT